MKPSDELMALAREHAREPENSAKRSDVLRGLALREADELTLANPSSGGPGHVAEGLLAVWQPWASKVQQERWFAVARAASGGGKQFELESLLRQLLDVRLAAPTEAARSALYLTRSALKAVKYDLEGEVAAGAAWQCLREGIDSTAVALAFLAAEELSLNVGTAAAVGGAFAGALWDEAVKLFGGRRALDVEWSMQRLHGPILGWRMGRPVWADLVWEECCGAQVSIMCVDHLKIAAGPLGRTATEIRGALAWGGRARPEAP